MVTETGIEELSKYFADDRSNVGKVELRSARKWRLALQTPVQGAKKDETWLRTFKALVQRPDVAARRYKDFGQLNATARMFVICCPIDPTTGANALRSVKVIHDLLSRESIPIEPLEDLLKRGAGGLVTCNCPIYLHYCWCKHVYAVAIQHGIIRAPFFPLTRNPRNRNLIPEEAESCQVTPSYDHERSRSK